MLFDDERPFQFFTCRSCGQSMSDEESTWLLDVKWPVKIKMKGDGSLGYMLAEMQDQDIFDRLDLSTVICEACKGSDIEQKEWDSTPDWAKKAKEQADQKKKEAADADESTPN